MSTVRTTVAELATGLGMTGLDSLEHAIATRPAAMTNVGGQTWAVLEEAHASGAHRDLFQRSWANGRAFFEAADGLRGRVPLRVEWKGDHRPVGHEAVPADLRVDHVFLVSHKDDSHILHNPAPAHLFDRLLAERRGENGDWYAEVVPVAYRSLWASVRTALGLAGFPGDPCALSGPQREVVKRALSTGRAWPAPLREPYAEFCREVSAATAARWSSNLRSAAAAEAMYWRLVRLSGAPYFLLGSVDGRDIRLRVATPWDWRQHFQLDAFRVEADDGAGQPVVRWTAEVRERTTGDIRRVDGHVEVRWSKGRFRRPPEAKVYLDTPHEGVAGYFPLRQR